MKQTTATQGDDFEGEFNPIRVLSTSELEKDQLVQTLKKRKRSRQPEEHLNNESDVQEESITSTRMKKGCQVKYPKYAKLQGLRLFNSFEENPYDSPENNDLRSQKVEESEDASNKADPKKKEIENFDDSFNSPDSELSISRYGTPLLGPSRLTGTESSGNDSEKPLTEEVQEKYKSIEIESQPFSSSQQPEFNPDDVKSVKGQVLAQLNGKNGFPNLFLSSIKEKYDEIYATIEHTVRDNEGHSLLLVGPRASGKSAMIQRALKVIESKYSGQYFVVRLNASIHYDDKIALREIARQFDYNVHKQANGESSQKIATFEQRSLNDTLSNILSILDDSIGLPDNENKEGNDKSDDASDSEGERNRISIIFVIDEFEKFTNSSKQTLLYNLFDLSQSSSTPICVIGMTPKVTAREQLEKRVRSRFSQRLVLLNKPVTLEEFWSNAKLGLIINEKESDLDANYVSAWNKRVNDLFSGTEKDGSTNIADAIPSYLKRLVLFNYYSVKNYRDFNNSCVYAVSKVSPQQPLPQDKDFSFYLRNSATDHVQEIVATLSQVELYLAIAAARWVEKFDSQVVNFNLAYKEYEEMMKTFNANNSMSSLTSSTVDSSLASNIRVGQKIWPPSILRNSWEVLYRIGLLLDSPGVTTNREGNIITNVDLNKNYIIEDNKMVQLDISLDELSEILGDQAGVLTRL